MLVHIPACPEHLRSPKALVSLLGLILTKILTNLQKLLDSGLKPVHLQRLQLRRGYPMLRQQVIALRSPDSLLVLRVRLRVTRERPLQHPLLDLLVARLLPVAGDLQLAGEDGEVHAPL